MKKNNYKVIGVSFFIIFIAVSYVGIKNNAKTIYNDVLVENKIEYSKVADAEEIINTDVSKISESTNIETHQPVIVENKEVKKDSIPGFSGKSYYVLNNNKPYFSDDMMTTESYERYSEFDNLGRCGYAISCIGKDLMPTGERGSIGMIKPTGWHTIRYDGIDGQYLYNRCHLIGFQLTGETTNEKNLITGTRYLNINGMLQFENKVAEFIKETNNHVLYRVTPVFEGDNLLASGVIIEAKSVEDNGKGIEFNVYCYNVQPGIIIDYRTGDSYKEEQEETVQKEKNISAATTTIETKKEEKNERTYILNTNTKKFHLTDCSSVSKMSDKNKKEVVDSRDNIINKGYQPCKICNP